MNTQAYFEMTDAADPRDLADIVSGSRLRHPLMKEESQMEQKQHTRCKRSMIIALVCAATLLIGGGIAAGAAMKWDAGAVFSRFMEKPAKEPVDYSAYAALGTDIGETMDFGDFTVTVDSIMTDGQVVYVVYEYTVPDVTAQLPDREIQSVQPMVMIRLLDPENHNFPCMLSGRGIDEQADENGVHHAIFELFAEDTAVGKVLSVRCGTVNAAIKEGDELVNETVTYPEQEKNYASDSTVLDIRHGSADFMTPFCEDSGHVSEVVVSALSVRLTLDRLTEEAWPPKPKEGAFSAAMTSDSYNRELVAVYEDGTEAVLSGNWDDIAGGVTEDDGFCMTGRMTLSLNRPLSLDGLTAVRFNSTEIAVG